MSSRQRREAAVARAKAPKPGALSGLYAPQVAEQTATGTHVARLLPAVYEAFEKGIPMIGKVPANEIEAAWVSGAEFVLRKLRLDIALN